MTINQQSESFKTSLIEVINNHNILPASNIYYIIKDVFNEVSQMYKRILEEDNGQDTSISEEEK